MDVVLVELPRAPLVVGLAPGVPAHRVDALAPGEDEQDGGVGHLGDVVAVAQHPRAAPDAVIVTDAPAVARAQHDEGHLGVRVEEVEHVLQQPVGVLVQAARAGGDQVPRQAGALDAGDKPHPGQLRLVRESLVERRRHRVEDRNAPVPRRELEAVFQGMPLSATGRSHLVDVLPLVLIRILLADRRLRMALPERFPQRALPVLVEGDAEADDFEHVLAPHPLCFRRRYGRRTCLCRWQRLRLLPGMRPSSASRRRSPVPPGARQRSTMNSFSVPTLTPAIIEFQPEHRHYFWRPCANKTRR